MHSFYDVVERTCTTDAPHNRRPKTSDRLADTLKRRLRRDIYGRSLQCLKVRRERTVTGQ